MDVLRARAYLDLLLGKVSRPDRDAPGGGGNAGPHASAVPAGFVGKVTLRFRT